MGNFSDGEKKSESRKNAIVSDGISLKVIYDSSETTNKSEN